MTVAVVLERIREGRITSRPDTWPTVRDLAERVRSRHGWKTGHDEITLADVALELVQERDALAARLRELEQR